MRDTSLENPTPSSAPDQQPVLFELYHENSKQRASDLAFAQRIYAVNNNPLIHEVAARTFKRYPGAIPTALPPVVPTDGFERTAAERRSVRRFTTASLTRDHIARLTYFASGITGHLDQAAEQVRQPIRSAPSAGALYPVELYAVVRAVDGVEPGVYHYAVYSHALELILSGDWSGRLGELTSDPATFANAAVCFVLTGVFGRPHFKYGERAYRFTLLEAGHVCQNLLLTATSLELGAVAVGGFLDDELHELLNLDGVDEAALYLVAVGWPAPRPRPASPEQEQRELAQQILESLRS